MEPQGHRVGVVECAVFDLATAHRRNCGVTRLGETPRPEGATVVTCAEDGVAHGRAVLLSSRLDGVQRNLHRFVAVAGVGFWLGIETLLVVLIPRRASAGELAGRHPTKADVRALGRGTGRIDE